ncbi:branched-chain amino acid ABC transporter permease [Paracidovorax wautersii]|jgi:branched-chain amino acid transport system permease protein|uniref:Amino acid/amide ABC transporter membrane protein 2, HAAT family n=1 Tax=Paracidovorax wautersii TaxID=1177982 RepID=A0A1I2DZB1_9BURK|nr:branched-chain amino acid ABC transporter permease [Paracidovorax wautersii]GAO20727.1 inner-membrane translocator [Alicycliphilus sp. B1]SFE85623.1 amino acid/amide ABC transporter membrane protein 2, HAAT family [Paracidovorax wautersii]
MTDFLRPSRALLPLLFVLLACVPFAAAAAQQPFWTSFFARILVYAIAASALNLALGYGGLVSFGHALFLGVGAYAVALPAFHGIGSGWVHLLFCLAGGAAVALVIGAISLRTSGMAFIMITLAFAQMGYFLLVSLKVYGGDDGLPLAAPSRFGALDLGSAPVLYGAAWAVLLALTWWMSRLRAAPFGMALRAARQNARRVDAMGLQSRRLQLAAFTLSGTACALAGALLANLNAFVSPSSMSWSVSGELIVMVVLGGIGTVAGPVVGALVFLGLEEGLKGVTEHWMVLFGPLIVLMALFGRRGIVGWIEALELSRWPARAGTGRGRR